ncbi:MAG: hypothetical protein J0H94_02870 [Rhizobiales bacterium]|nr:hypothetical protein [Hyphomicrobiales bacterium]
MRSIMIALAAVASLSAAAPAFAASAAERDYYQTQQEPVQFQGLSDHCKQVLNSPDRWGQKEVTFCQNSIP